jgi:adiponectin receptor
MLPIFQSVVELNWARVSHEIGTGWYLAEGLSHLTGVGVFVGRCPKRLSPETFDIWGHSCQLWHAFVVLGSSFHVLALLATFNYLRSTRLDERDCSELWITCMLEKSTF